MREFRQVIENPIVRAGATVIATVGMLGLAGCSSNGPNEVRVVPNIGPVLTDKAHCNADPTFERPCVALIRTQPNRSADFLNADATQTTPVKWPHESFGGIKGEAVTVVCQVKGEAIYDVSGIKTGKHVSRIWDVVEVPYKHLSESKKNLAQTPKAMYGYVSDLLLGNPGIYDQLDACTSAQNPAGAPAVN